MSKEGADDHQIFIEDLTWREQDILFLLEERLTNREISNRLHLAESTVKDYVGKILSKLYVKNRREAVEQARSLGLLDDRKPATRSTTNIPTERTPFIGREEEIEKIKKHLKETRLLTITGQGGIGKTRLSLKAATEIEDDFKDGCFLVSLAPVRSKEHIVQKIAEAIRFPISTQKNPLHQLVRYLEKKQLLLIMDNFEHLLDGVSIINDILETDPQVKILATSRERLNLQGETVSNLKGMGFPDKVEIENAPNYDAIALFIQSARKIVPDFAPSKSDLGQIINICQIIQGMPLAIELAAAWIQILRIDEVAAELEKGIDFLSAAVRDAPERHRSIRAVFDHSWSMLNQAEQKIFMQLSVFRGGFTREAAQQVTGASLHQLAGLSNKSFLSHDPNSGRLEVHELLRQYGSEQLEKSPADNTAAYEAHAAYFADFMKEKLSHLQDRRQMLAHAEIESDIENVRAAWQHCLSQKNIPKMWKFIIGLMQVYWFRGWNLAGRELFADTVRVLQQENKDEYLIFRALAQALQAYFMAWLGQAEQGYELAQESVAVLQKFNHPEALGYAYITLILNSYFLNQSIKENAARKNLQKIAVKIDDKRLLTLSLFNASMVALIKKNYAEAERQAESCLNITKESGDLIYSTFPLIAWGHVAFARGDYEDARRYFQRCLKVSEDVGFRWAIANSRKYLGKVALLMDKPAEAEKHLLQSLRISKEIEFVRDIINILYDYALLQVAQDNPERATELLALVSRHPTSLQFRWLEGCIRDSAKGLLANLKDEMSEEVYTAALKRGQEMELDEVVADLIDLKP